MQTESERVRSVYQNRDIEHDHRYDRTRPAVYMAIQERHRALVRLLEGYDLSKLDIFEVGCGDGSNLLELLSLGCTPARMIGNDVREDVLVAARAKLPETLALVPGDARQLTFEPESYNLVYQSTVFSSILSQEIQAELAAKMWRWVKPGGAVLWYDFAYNNPANPNVRGVSLNLVRRLFPEGFFQSKWVTLAPPVSRRVVKLHPAMYSVFNTLPFLRTHRLCLIRKEKK